MFTPGLNPEMVYRFLALAGACFEALMVSGEVSFPLLKDS
jgi:hypothetical protein